MGLRNRENRRLEVQADCVFKDAAGVATNSVAWRVKDGKASCVLNGTVAKTLDAAQYAGPDKLKSLDGNYGIRVSHNVELTVSGFMKH